MTTMSLADGRSGIPRQAWTEENLPDTIQELESLRLELLSSIQEIQFKLGDDDRKRAAVRDGDGEYFRWRNRAKYALNRTQEEYRLVKAKVHRLRSALYVGELYPDVCDPDDPHDMLYVLYNILARLVRDEVFIPSSEERASLDHAHNWLRRNAFFI